MSKAIIAAARQLRDEIRSQEDTIDAALAGQARLVSALLEARRAANVSARTGENALERAFEAIEHGRELRKSVLAMHKELAQLNVRELAVGDVFECPPAGALPELRVVASQSEAA